jgi:hypothetical protein
VLRPSRAVDARDPSERRSLREISAELAAAGHFNPFNPKSIKSMLEQ